MWVVGGGAAMMWTDNALDIDLEGMIDTEGIDND
jgi:hypothetical protein